MTSCSLFRFVSAPLLTAALLTGCAAPDPEIAQESSPQSSSRTCAATRLALDAAARSAPRDATYDAVVAYAGAECGTSFHTAGPSALGPDRLVRIGSLTKSYVSVLTLQAVAAGRVALDARVDAYVPDLPPGVAPVTVRQLLQHTSGIFNYTNVPSLWTTMEAKPLTAWTPRELVDLAADRPPYFAPGAGWMYSNTNYVLLGMILEAVEDAPIASLVRTRILEPNGLDHTFFEGSEPVSGTLAPGYAKDGTEVTHDYTLSWAWAAGAIAATPEDGARFVELLATGALLPPELQAELLTGVATPQPGLRYGLGVFLIDGALSGGAGPGIGHGGDIPGYHTATFHFPEAKMTIFGAVNSDKGSGNDVLAATLSALFAPPAPPAIDGEARARGEHDR